MRFITASSHADRRKSTMPYVARDRRHMHDLENASDVLGPHLDAPANDLQQLPKAAE